MCGRYTFHTRDRIAVRACSLDPSLTPRYNIAPSQDVFAVADFGLGLEGRMLTWGLIPSWSTDGKGFINARVETLEERPSFSESFRLRRCLIPADGFFEWKRTGREKRPFYIQLLDETPMMFAGIWDVWRNHGKVITSCAIITTPANELVGKLHDRMPAMLPAEFHDAWLNRKTDRIELLKMLRPFSSAAMKMHPVSSSVNSPANDSADLLIPVEAELGQTLSLFNS
jgi:putative SOS response-associated peptidase YedK